MKKFYIVSSFFLLIGLIMTIYGLANNGAKTILFDRNGEVGIFKENKVDQNYPVDDIKELDLNISFGNVSIIQGEKFAIKQKGTNISKIKVQNKDGHVTISDGSKKNLVRDKNILAVGYVSTWSENEITVTVPMDKKIKILNSNNTYQTLDLNGDIVDTLRIQSKNPGYLFLQDVNLSENSILNFDNDNYSDSENYGYIQDTRIEARNSTIQGQWSFSNFEDLIGMEVSNSVVKNFKLKLDEGGLFFKDSTLEAVQITGQTNAEFTRVKFVGQNSLTLENEVDDEINNQIRLNNIQGFGIKVDSDTLKINTNDHKEPTTKRFEINPTNKNGLTIKGETGQIYLRNVK